MSSPFTKIPKSAWLASNAHAFAFFDAYPVSEGHALIVPHRVVPTWFDATADEQQALMQLVEEVKEILDARFAPAGYNIGINAGEAAGQTVMHLHVHLIPRYRGDMPDPRGGVRHVIPWKGNYLKEPSPVLSTGGQDDPFIDHLHPLFAQATRVSIVAAFVQDSGLKLLRETVRSALERGAQVQLLTGDYFNLTQVDALQRLLDWMDGSLAIREEAGSSSQLSVRVVEVGKRDGWPKSFHPKSWRFESVAFGVAFVGSSNLSRTALTTGTEWNLQVRRERDPSGYAEVVRAFDTQWKQATPLSLEWVQAYARRVHANPKGLPAGEQEEEAPVEVPTPHSLQEEALKALEKARKQGRQRALIVHATGLGKTWLAAFDVRAFAEYFHTPARVLFLAHRAEILQQAADTFRTILPDATFGWYVGSRSQTEGRVIFASIQKLARVDNLAAFDRESFDYVIIDEVHHAAASSYRRILEHLEPAFWLGLTATPDRADEADIRPLFDDFIAHRASIGEGIEMGFLSPFHYFGLADTTDYKPIPWRGNRQNGRFQTAALTEALATQQRMEKVWGALQEHAGHSTLIFCASIAHAQFVAGWLRERDMRVAAIFSGPESADRDAALRDLRGAKLDAICAVDILNEGVDIPRVDRVVMLRPTESPVVFMQQLGRGLRSDDGKSHLTVLDFVGNHRVFLDRVRTLLSLGARTPDEKSVSLRGFLTQGEAPVLPPGCKINFDLEAISLLKDLLPQSSKSALVRTYRQLRDARGKRPSASELHRLNFNLRTLGKHGGWFGFLADEGDLTDAEYSAWTSSDERGRQGQTWFHELETTRLNKSYKMVVIQTLLDHGALHTGMPIAELASASHRILRRSPELFRDITGIKRLPDPRNPDPDTWRTYWDDWPLKVWAGDKRRPIERPWFIRTDGSDGDFRSQIPIPIGSAACDAFVAMTRELVDYRLAEYRDRHDATLSETGAFRVRVIRNQRDPILKLPSRKTHPDIPTGETTVALPDGQKWRFRFVKIAVNVARPVGESKNRLPDLLRTWFGPAAGERGTNFEVEFRPAPEGWRVEPLGGQVIPFPRPGHIIAFPNLQAAAGVRRLAQTQTPDWSHLRVPEEQHRAADFAVRVHGDSMQGGEAPIRDGDWALMRWARGDALEGVQGRVALVRHQGDRDAAPAYYLKRVVKGEDGFELRSDNPRAPSLAASADTVVVALHVDTLAEKTANSLRIDLYLEALKDELERRDYAVSSPYGAAFRDAVERIIAQADGQEVLAARLKDWLMTAYGMDGETSTLVVKKVGPLFAQSVHR